jgi:hypothetical protein
MRPGDLPSSDGQRSCAPEAPIDLAVLDRVLNRLYAAGLSIATLSSRPDVGAEVRGRLYDTLDELDGVVADLRNAAFGQVVRDGDTRPHGADSTAPTAKRSRTPRATSTTSKTAVPIARRDHLSHPPPR